MTNIFLLHFSLLSCFTH